MTRSLKWLAVSTIVAIATAAPLPLHAVDSQPGEGDTPGSTAPAKPKRDWYPFSGTVAAVNKQANTISLKKKEGERVIKVDAKSELEINGKRALLSEVKVGHYIHGKLRKDSLGTEVILSAKFEKERPKKPADGAGSAAQNEET